MVASIVPIRLTVIHRKNSFFFAKKPGFAMEWKMFRGKWTTDTLSRGFRTWKNAPLKFPWLLH
jgi:hypothetical protein